MAGKLSDDARTLDRTLQAYPGWLSFSKDARTMRAVRSLCSRGIAQANQYGQIRATNPDGSPIAGDRGKVGEPLPNGWSVEKATAAGLRPLSRGL